jgi:hypothetical protein
MVVEQEQLQQRYATVTVLEKLLSSLTSISMQVAVVDLGIPDRLRDGPRSVHSLAKEIAADEDVLLLFMRALTSEEIFKEVECGVFAHTEGSRCLQSDAPGSLRGIAELLKADWTRKVWDPEEVLHTLKTGQPAFEHVFGEDFWTYMSTHRDQNAIFSKAQTIFSGPKDDAIANAYDFDGIYTLVDVGGGEGSFLAKIVSDHPGMKGILFDRPAVVERARTQIAQRGIADRCQCIGGDFFKGVPVGADAYVLKQVLHDWSDEESVRILDNCRSAMAPSGKVLVAAYIVPEPPAKPLKYLMAGMWVRLNCRGGYERTEEQFRRVFERAGLELVKVVATASTHSILEARRRTA